MIYDSIYISGKRNAFTRYQNVIAMRRHKNESVTKGIQIPINTAFDIIFLKRLLKSLAQDMRRYKNMLTSGTVCERVRYIHGLLQ